MVAQHFRGRGPMRLLHSTEGMQHGAHTQEGPKIVHRPSRGRQHGLVRGRKINRIGQLDLARLEIHGGGLGPAIAIHQVAKHRAADPDLIALLQLVLSDGRAIHEGAVAAFQVLNSALLPRAAKEAVSA